MKGLYHTLKGFTEPAIIIVVAIIGSTREGGESFLCNAVIQTF
jgi:hypothetical protein